MFEITAQTTGADECRTLTQKETIGGQLLAGARYFDFRPVVWSEAPGYHLGHFTVVGLGVYEFVGATGVSLASALDDVNNFLALCDTNGLKELVILKFSHYNNFDREATSGYGFTEADKRNLIQTVNRRLTPGTLFLGEGSVDLNTTPIQRLIGDGARVLTVYDDIPESLVDPAAGVFRYGDIRVTNANLTVYDSYAGTDEYAAMHANQVEHLRYFVRWPDVLFLLSWTLTQQFPYDEPCILDLAVTANDGLFADWQKIMKDGYMAPERLPNVIYTDLAERSYPVYQLCLQSMQLYGMTGLLLYDAATASVQPWYATSSGPPSFPPSPDYRGPTFEAVGPGRTWGPPWSVLGAGAFSVTPLQLGNVFAYAPNGEIAFWSVDAMGAMTQIGETQSVAGGWRDVVCGTFFTTSHPLPHDLAAYAPAAGTITLCKYYTGYPSPLREISTVPTRTTWTNVVAGAFLSKDAALWDLVLYDAGDGTLEFWRTDGEGGLARFGSAHRTRRTWSLIVGGRFALDPQLGRDALMCYDRAAGVAEFFGVTPSGGLVSLGVLSAMRMTYTACVTGAFGAAYAGLDALFFYDAASGTGDVYQAAGTGIETVQRGLRVGTGWTHLASLTSRVVTAGR